MARAAGAVKTGGVDQRAVFRGLQQDAAVVAAARIAVLGHREGDVHRGAGDPLPDQPERGQDLVEGGERLKEEFPRAELQEPFRDRQIVPGGGFRVVSADIREDARAGFFGRLFRERPAAAITRESCSGSGRETGFAAKVFVLTARAPAARYSRWMRRTVSGEVRLASSQGASSPVRE